MAQISIRSELFEHCIYPSQTKITTQNILNLFRSLHLLSSFDYKITLDNWIEQSLKHIQSLTLSEAEMYFWTYDILMRNIETKGAAEEIKLGDDE